MSITLFFRRDRMFSTQIALAAVWLFAAGQFTGCATVGDCATPRLNTTVLIVGGGLTGLTTAYELNKAGIDSIILEASPRIGGRIQSVRLMDGAIAEGHMEEYFERNPAVPLLRELGLGPQLVSDQAHSSVRIGGTNYSYRGDGNRDDYLKGIFSPAEAAAFLIWNDKVWALYTNLHSSHISGQPLAPDLAALTKISFSEFVARERLPEKVSEWIRVTIEPELAIEWDRISALDGIDEFRLFLDTPDGFGEKNYHVKGGNSKFTAALAAKLRRRPILNAMVTEIRQTAGSVVVRYLQDGHRYREVTAKYVVITVPVHNLGRIQFIPALSEDKKRAIATTRMGSYLKVHLSIAPDAGRLWGKDGASLLTLLSDSPAGSIYDATDLQNAPDGRDRVLTLLVHARFAKPLLGLPSDDIREACVQSLDKLFPGVQPHVRFAEIFVFPEAVAYWPLELGRSRFDELAAKLREPQGRLFIGGDTTENSHSEGAVLAAFRISQAIAKREGRVIPPR
jgi:monoamine oxidase